MGFKPITMTPTFSYASMSESSRELHLCTSIPGYHQYGLRGAKRRESLRAFRDLPPSRGYYTVMPHWALQSPAEFVIGDRNQRQDADNFVALSNAEAVRQATFEYIQLTFDNEVLVTWPSLVARVFHLCRSRLEIRVLVIRIPC